MSVRVRLAPSPTGPLHVGTARTALFNFLFAKGHDGTFLLRIEDTDRERSKPEYEEGILEGLRWLGISWDEGPDVGGPHAPYRQSERVQHYRAALEQLLREGKAVEEDSTIRLQVEPQEVAVSDLIRGEVRFPATAQGDFVIARSLDDPLFHLAVVVDDAAMRITHVIRGEDHLSNTPRHILLQRALGLPTPQYAHLPLLLDTERRKLSKRRTEPRTQRGTGAETGLASHREAGVLPEAMVNFLALLGWNPKTTDEVFSLADLVERFDLQGVQQGGAVYDERKLQWLQRAHVRRAAVPTLADRVAPFLERDNVRFRDRGQLERALEVWRERGGMLGEAPDALRLYTASPALEPADIPWRGTTARDAQSGLAFARDTLEQLPEGKWGSRQELQRSLLEAVDSAGLDRGAVLWPLRYALSGRRESPGPGEISWVLGREETLERIRRARAMLGT